MDEILEVNNMHKIFHTGDIENHVIKGISFEIFKGEFVVFLGPSGSGKSTILNILGGLDQMSSGEMYFSKTPLHQAGDAQLTKYRRDHIGFVFQFYNLISSLSAIENVKMSAVLSSNPIDPVELMDQVGLLDKSNDYPSKLSGGQQQRIAIARALSKNPDLLLCDEPTGALDIKTGMQILSLLKSFNKKYKKTVVVITHNPQVSKISDRSFYIRDGLIDWIKVNPSPLDPEEVEWV